MIGVMVCGHGKFATGLKTAMELISGQHENVEFFDFSEGKTTEEVDAFYQESINKFGEELENVVVLTDLAGGTPFNRAAIMSGNDSRIKVLSGTNLALLLSVVMSKDMFGADQIDEFLSNAIEEAKDSVIEFKIKASDSCGNSEDDGI